MSARLLGETKLEVPWAPVVLAAPSFISLLRCELGRERQDAELQNPYPTAQVPRLKVFSRMVSAIFFFLIYFHFKAAFLCFIKHQ